MTLYQNGLNIVGVLSVVENVPKNSFIKYDSDNTGNQYDYWLMMQDSVLFSQNSVNSKPISVDTNPVLDMFVLIWIHFPLTFLTCHLLVPATWQVWAMEDNTNSWTF